MQYIAHRRFRGVTLNKKHINIPFGSECESSNGILYYNGSRLMTERSENCYQYFARNDDGNGLRRGKLTQEILKLLRPLSYPAKVPPQWTVMSQRQINAIAENRAFLQRAWERIWGDLRLRKFKRVEFADHWTWNHDFYNAAISDLEYILNIILEEKNVSNHYDKRA